MARPITDLHLLACAVQDATGTAGDIAIGWAIGVGAPFAFRECPVNAQSSQGVGEQQQQQQQAATGRRQAPCCLPGARLQGMLGLWAVHVMLLCCTAPCSLKGACKQASVIPTPSSGTSPLAARSHHPGERVQPTSFPRPHRTSHCLMPIASSGTSLFTARSHHPGERVQVGHLRRALHPAGRGARHGGGALPPLHPRGARGRVCGRETKGGGGTGAGQSAWWRRSSAATPPRCEGEGEGV